MPKERPLFVGNVEVFHDRDDGAQNAAAVLQGIATVDSITGGLEVVGTSRQIKIASEGSTAVRPDQIRWPGFQADFNLVLTSRPIYRATPRGAPANSPLGDLLNEWFDRPEIKALFEPVLGSAAVHNRVAILTTAGTGRINLADTTSHELAHLFGLKSQGDVDPAHPEHCKLPDCIMHFAQTLLLSATNPEPTAGWQKLIDRFKRPRAKSDPETYSQLGTFCMECTDELIHHANLRALKNLKR